jgi:hypothetical protein
MKTMNQGEINQKKGGAQMKAGHLSPSVIDEIVQKLVGADPTREIELCEQYDVTQDEVCELMSIRGYDWNDRWEKNNR